MKSKNQKRIKGLSTFILIVMLGISISCTSKKKVIDDDFAVDSAEAGFSDADLAVDGAPDPSVSVTDGTTGDEFSDFDKEADTAKAAPETQPPADSTASLEKQLNDISDPSTPAEEVTTPPPTIETPIAQEETPSTVAESAPAVTEAPPVIETPPEIVEATPVTPEPVAQAAVSKITNLQYKGNANGGTVVISSDIPLNYTTRVNSSSNQVVIEVQDVVVADRLKRPLNTKDMSSSIGHVDVYQKKDSKIARFVVQLRPNSPEPLVQPEGNSLLIIGSAVEGSGPNPNPKMLQAQNNEESGSGTATVTGSNSSSDLNNEITAQGIMSSDDLEEFLSNNNKFYGKKISIETTDMDVRDILKLIAEESGVNMVFDDDINGKSTLKLRKVPWDQALVILLKSKKFGYRRQGSILRIAKMDTLIKEDGEAVKLKESRATIDPLIVRNFSINYADIEKLEAKIKEFITDTKKDAVNRGRVTSDARTSTLIVTETETKLAQIAQLIKALDTQPQQVMIEAKIIEASDDYTRSIGGSIGLNRNSITGGTPGIAAGEAIPNFNTGRVAVPVGTSNYSSNGLNISPSVGQSGSFLGNIFFGTLGSFGNLDAQLALDELQNRLKILSSPRVAVMTNTSATIKQGGTILQKSTSTSSPSTGGATTETFNPVPVGVTLKVTPQISNTGTVRLQLDVQRSFPSTALGTGGIEDRNVSTQIIVKNGDTAVIGGVFQSDTFKSVQGVPGLMDIPILGTLFKGQKETNTKNELLIFVTPKIIPLLNQVFKAEGESTTPVQ